MLIGAEGLLPRLLVGHLRTAQTVMEELHEGRRVFGNLHHADIATNPARAAQADRFNRYQSSLATAGVQTLALSDHPAVRDRYQFFACLADEDVMDPGEAECFTHATYRNLILYTDDRGAYEAVEAYNAGACPCPYSGQDAPPHHPVEVHSSAWLLLEGVRLRQLTLTAAEDLWSQMMDVWPRHPGKTLTLMQTQSNSYW